MPGIVGLIAAPGKCNHELGVVVDRMLDAIPLDSSLSAGSLVQEELGVGVGWVSRVGSYSDCQPIWNQAKSVGLIFAGEHFPDRNGSQNCHGPGAASSLLDSHDRDGTEFFERLNGIFSGLLLDLRDRRAILFNDRYGLGRIYYHETPDAFYFASEAKCLLRIFPELRTFDPLGLGEFFSCGCALQNRTLFSGISLLPAASEWTFRPKHDVGKKAYFNTAEWEGQEQLPESDYYARLHETFTRVLPGYVADSRESALSLTGGLDSRMIIAGLSPAAGTLPTYTFGGMYRDCADLKLARRIAKTAQQSHQTITVDEEFFPQFSDLAEESVYLTDGAMDVTGSVELFANRRAREIAPIRITGNYGSEVLRGNVAFKVAPLTSGVFHRDFLPELEHAAEVYSEQRQGSDISFVVNKQMPWHHFARLAIEQSQLTVRSPFIDNELVALAYQAPSGIGVNRALAHRFIADCNAAFAEIPTDRGVAVRPGASVNRFKLFCEEFGPRLEYLFDYGMPQWLARVNRLTKPLHLERYCMGRQKFYHFRMWYRDYLAQFVKDVLLDPSTLARPYLNGANVEKYVTHHLAGRGNYTREIHKLLTSELIERRLLRTN